MNYRALERAIGHQFADTALLDLAMTHPSYALQFCVPCQNRNSYPRFDKKGELTIFFWHPLTFSRLSFIVKNSKCPFHKQ